MHGIGEMLLTINESLVAVWDPGPAAPMYILEQILDAFYTYTKP
jgi:hypothetical protein